jgi:hypothetical protein
MGVPKAGRQRSPYDLTSDTEETRTRPLVACDVWVSVARAAYRGEATVVDGSGVSGEVVDYAVTFETSQLDRVGSRPRLLTGPKMPEVRPPNFLERMLYGQYQDDGEDRILISTVYFLGMEGAVPPVNRSWQPFVGHNCFWNLSHRAKNAVPRQPPAPVRIFTGLAGGWGDIIGNQMLSQLNELSDRVNNAANTTDNVGRYWTA